MTDEEIQKKVTQDFNRLRLRNEQDFERRRLKNEQDVNRLHLKNEQDPFHERKIQLLESQISLEARTSEAFHL